MTHASKYAARPYSSRSYYQLKKSLIMQTKDYRNFLGEVDSELNHRNRPWSIKLQQEIRQLADYIQEQLENAMHRLP